jgi:hypothetical protein
MREWGPCGGCGVEADLNVHNACADCEIPNCPCSFCTRRGFMVALPALAASLDHLGLAEPVELYAALIVDARGRETADALMAAAKLDGRVTHGQWLDLKKIWKMNHEKK